MSLTEQYFPPLNRYANTNKGVSMEAQEAWLKRFPQKRAENKPNGGIIQSVADTRELFLRPMSVADRKKAIAQAQREHRQALRNLAKQDAMDAKEIAKQLTVWRRENRKSEEPSREMTTALGQNILDTLKDKGFYDPSDFPKSKEYLRKIITQIRSLGYAVVAEKQKRAILRYVLSKQ